MKIKELKEQRGALVRKAQEILDLGTAERRDLSGSEENRFDRIKGDILALDSKIATEDSEMRMDFARSENRSNGNFNMPLEGYSLVRAINSAASGRLDGIELEASQEIARRSGSNPSGFFVPTALLAERRGMTVTGDAGIYGGATVQTDIADDILAALRPLSRVIQAGATTFSGLSHNLAIPAQAAATTAEWKTEVAALGEVNSEIEQILLSPKRVGAFSELSNQLLVATNGNVERFVRNDLLSAIASAIDQAALAGAGSPAPTGILSTSGIGDVAGGTNGLAPTWQNLVALVGKVSDANADLGQLAFLTNSKVMAKLRSSPKVSSTDSVMTLEGKTLLDYPVYSSNHVPSNLTKGTSSGVASAIVFGNWEDVLIGQFGEGIDLIIDRFSKATTGITRIVAQSYVDIAIRRAASFAAMKDALTV